MYNWQYCPAEVVGFFRIRSQGNLFNNPLVGIQKVYVVYLRLDAKEKN